jgi:hypothetical protein
MVSPVVGLTVAIAIVPAPLLPNNFRLDTILAEIVLGTAANVTLPNKLDAINGSGAL